MMPAAMIVAAVTDMETAGTAETEKDNYLITRFGALCFFLSAVEYIIPKPLPFLRLGISNVPLIIAAGFFSPSAYSLLAFVKIIAQGFLGGTFFSWIFLFSAAGTAMSAALMFFLKRALKSAVSAVGLSVAGALASNAAQILIARVWIFGESVRTIVPLLLGAGVVTGFATGVFTEFFMRKSRWLEKTRQRAECSDFSFRENQTARPEAAPEEEATAKSTSRKNKRKQTIFAALRLAAGVFSIALIGIFSAVEARAVVFLIFYAALCRAGKRPHSLPVLISLLAITAFNLYPPRGTILAEIAGFRIAADSLRAGLSRAVFFEALIFISRWTFMPGKFQLPQIQLKREKSGKALKFLTRLSHLLAETLVLFGKLNSKPDKKAERRSAGRRLSLEGAAAYIDSILQRIDGTEAEAGA